MPVWSQAKPAGRSSLDICALLSSPTTTQGRRSSAVTTLLEPIVLKKVDAYILPRVCVVGPGC